MDQRAATERNRYMRDALGGLRKKEQIARYERIEGGTWFDQLAYSCLQIGITRKSNAVHPEHGLRKTRTVDAGHGNTTPQVGSAEPAPGRPGHTVTTWRET